MPKEKIRVKASIKKIDEKYIYLAPYSDKYDSCDSCNSFLCDKKSKVRKVEFQDGFTVGEDVYIVADSSSVMKHALILYGVPVLVIFALAIIFSMILKLPDMIVAILSMVSLPITYFIIRKLYKNGCYSLKIERLD